MQNPLVVTKREREGSLEWSETEREKRKKLPVLSVSDNSAIKVKNQQ